MKLLSASRGAALRRRLLRWYGTARRDLPWRFPVGEGDPYRVWISEAMLQQTQVATVVPYYRRFLGRFPTLGALAAASEGEVLAAWAGLGYYARGRALLRAAREAVARHGGLPGSVEELRALPGFGPYTAGAVASIAFGVATPAVDGNVARVLARLFLVEDDARGSRFRRRIWALAAGLHVVARPRVTAGRSRRGRSGGSGPLRASGGVHPGELNQALIELGALVCRPRAPGCGRCPLEDLCGARRAGRAGSVPVSGARPAARRLRLGAVVLTHRGRLLIARRAPAGLFGGMWGPPTVEVRRGADPGAVISAAIEGEPLEIAGGITYVGSVERRLTHRALELLVHTGRLRRAPAETGDLRLVEVEGLGREPIPAALMAAVELGLGGGARSPRRGGGRPR